MKTIAGWLSPLIMHRMYGFARLFLNILPDRQYLSMKRQSGLQWKTANRLHPFLKLVVNVAILFTPPVSKLFFSVAMLNTAYMILPPVFVRLVPMHLYNVNLI